MREKEWWDEGEGVVGWGGKRRRKNGGSAHYSCNYLCLRMHIKDTAKSG